MSYLVIVESPPKANTIKNYLGSGYKVIASKGHIRDLPKSTLGVDIENGFAPHYINIRGRGDFIKELRKLSKASDGVLLATDPDREGEAISWHLATILGIDPADVKRVTINEITKKAVREAVKNPGKLNMDLVDAQQTRRILDRIVGYKLSPFLWKTVKSGLSAGRVQTVATRIIVDRENEIRAFDPEEYWTVDAFLSYDGSAPFISHYYGKNGKKTPLKSQSDAEKVTKAVREGKFSTVSVKRTVRHKTPAPPFTTSTMLQEASKRLGFQSTRTMRAAQDLYEGINLGSELGGTHGLITYMRTDSLRISEDAQRAAAEFIKSRYGNDYCPKSPRNYKTKANAQDAHEAIRPSDVTLEPSKLQKYLSSDQFKLYKLIWDRFVASQMQSAEINSVAMEFECSGYNFRSSGYSIAFLGYMAIYNDTETDDANSSADNGTKDARLPDLKEGDLLDCDRVEKAQHFTEPPPRYNEASLIKMLEEKGIGRPSTIPPTITTIISRNYVRRDGKTLVPTELGEVTVKLMCENFPDIVDYGFTADMEDQLDKIGEGSADMQKVLADFWRSFEAELNLAKENIGDKKITIKPEETDIVCEKCGRRMVVKEGKYGKFAACPGYPECKNTKPLNENKKPAVKKSENGSDGTVLKCEVCGADMVERQGKFGSFYACSNFPQCTFTKAKVRETGVKCPDCGSNIVVRNKGKLVFYSCERYPDCKFSSWDAPVSQNCPECGKMLFRKKGKNMLICHNKDCGYTCEDKGSNSDEH